MLNGYKFKLGSANFSIITKSGSQKDDTFQIKSAKSGKKYGPFSMKNGNSVIIGTSKFRLSSQSGSGDEQSDNQLKAKPKQPTFCNV